MEHPDKQVHLKLSDLRAVFRAVDQMAAERIADREIFARIRERIPFYDDSFLRWLVRHTLHPEAEDDIMPDEVERRAECRLPDGPQGMEIVFTTVPPTVDQYRLVQYLQQFWHIVEFDPDQKRALLRPLTACSD